MTAIRRRWQVLVAVIVTMTVLPIALVTFGALSVDFSVWRFLHGVEFSEMVVTTVVLCAAVVTVSTLLGASLAWLLSHYSFPGHRVLSWLLVLPLAVPAYVSGFVYIGLLDHPGPVQSELRSTFGDNMWFPDVRSLWLCIIVLSLAYFPYPYIVARALLTEHAAATYHAARSLGAGPFEAAWRVTLPMTRPALAAGGMIVAMETMTDFATVQYFGVTTVSVGIHQVWVGMYDRTAATQLAGVVMVFALIVIAAERIGRGKARFHHAVGGAPLARQPLRRRYAILASTACLVTLLVSVGIPIIQLALWSAPSETTISLDSRFIDYVTNTTLLALIVAALCVIFALLLASATRFATGPITQWMGRAAAIGYAVPGPVIAIGVLIILAIAQHVGELFGLSTSQSLATGTLIGVVYAYVARFLALAWSTLDANLDKVSPALTDIAMSLGVAPHSVLRRVHLPLIRPGLGVAFVLIAVDVLKELPIMLLLRPLGFETLAVWVNQLATETRWESAGPPSLTIIVIATIPIVLVFRHTLSIRDH